MNLFSIPENPAPPGGTVLSVNTRDRWSLRSAYWRCGSQCAGTIAILPGLSEFIEKYFEVIGEMLGRNFDTAILDWRGQGLSGRYLSDRRKAHISDFQAYERDVEAFIAQVLRPFCRPPWFILGHSMGGAIALAKAHDERWPFARMVLSAPMIDVHGLRFPRLSRALAKGAILLGLGGSNVPGASHNPYMTAKFDGNLLTSDQTRYARNAAILKAHPELAIGRPTIAWLNAAFRFMRRFDDADFPRHLRTPTLILAAGADRLVDTAAAELFASRLKIGKGLTLPNARHEILMERDEIRALFFAAFDAFIPGEAERDLAEWGRQVT
ncbi:MAG TPA: alpha/beta hydrolase [Methylocella sp.]|nr:alpha/beta hydrolase [Methylocella sp.]